MKHHSRNRRRSIHRTILIVITFLLLIAVVAVGAYKCIVKAPQLPEKATASMVQSESSEAGTSEMSESEDIEQPDVRKPNYYNVLVCGVDNGRGGSDTNILVGIDADANQIHCVSIPRDTLVNVGRKLKKINAAYNIGGIDQLAEEVEMTLGVPVDFTVKVNLQGFIDLVNAIGGVDFNVPIDMNYDDPTQDLYIHFQKGMQHLTGLEAMEVVRFRHNNDGTGYGTEDLGRIATQQAFLKAVAKKMLTLSNVDKIGQFAKIFDRNVTSELSVGNMAWIGTKAMDMGLDHIKFSTLPGDGAGYYKGTSYYTLDADGVLALVNEAVNPYDTPRTMDDLNLLIP